MNSNYNFSLEIKAFQNDENVLAFIRSSKCTKEMINQVIGQNMSALQIAAINNKPEIVDALLKKGADIKTSNYALDAIGMAIYYGAYFNEEDKQKNLQVIKSLIKKKKKINFQEHNNPFMLSCQKGKNEVIQLLLDGSNDVDIMFKGIDGKTAIDHLNERKNFEAIKIVESYLMNNYLKENLSNKRNSEKKLKL